MTWKTRLSCVCRLAPAMLFLCLFMSSHTLADESADATTLRTALAGMRAWRQSVSSGVVKYDFTFTRYADKRLDTPEAVEREVNRRVAESERRVMEHEAAQGRDATLLPPEATAQFRQQAENLVRKLARDFEWRKKGVFVWSGSKERIDVGDGSDQFSPTARYDFVVSVIVCNGETARVYWESAGKIYGTVRSELQEVNDTAKIHPLLWVSDGTISALTDEHAFELTGTEIRNGRKGLWIKTRRSKESVLVCPEYGYCAVEKRIAGDNPGNVVYVAKAEDITQTDGVFFPTKVTCTSYAANGADPYVINTYVVTDACFNKPVDEKTFAPDFPPGTIITDYTYAPALKYSVHGAPDMRNHTLLALQERGAKSPQPAHASTDKPAATATHQQRPRAAGPVPDRRLLPETTGPVPVPDTPVRHNLLLYVASAILALAAAVLIYMSRKRRRS